MTINSWEKEGMSRKVPQIDFQGILAGAANFHDIQEKLLSRLNIMRNQEGVKRIGFVSGGVANRGQENILSSMRQLSAYTEKLRRESGLTILSSTDIFQVEGLWKRLPEPKLPEAEKSKKFLELFRGILRGGVTDIFMTPSWENSKGAKDEYNTAIEIGINIHYVSVDEEISKL